MAGRLIGRPYDVLQDAPGRAAGWVRFQVPPGYAGGGFDVTVTAQLFGVADPDPITNENQISAYGITYELNQSQDQAWPHSVGVTPLYYFQDTITAGNAGYNIADKASHSYLFHVPELNFAPAGGGFSGGYWGAGLTFADDTQGYAAGDYMSLWLDTLARPQGSLDTTFHIEITAVTIDGLEQNLLADVLGQSAGGVYQLNAVAGAPLLLTSALIDHLSEESTFYLDPYAAEPSGPRRTVITSVRLGQVA